MRGRCQANVHARRSPRQGRDDNGPSKPRGRYSLPRIPNKARRRSDGDYGRLTGFSACGSVRTVGDRAEPAPATEDVELRSGGGSMDLSSLPLL